MSTAHKDFQQTALAEFDELKDRIVADEVAGYGTIVVGPSGTCSVRFNGSSNLAALHAGATKLSQILLDAIFAADPSKPGRTN